MNSGMTYCGGAIQCHGQEYGPGCISLLVFFFCFNFYVILEYTGDSVVKNPPANAGDVGSIPGLEKSPGED